MGSNPGYLFYLRMSGTRPIYGLSNYCAILKKTDHSKVSASAMALTWISHGMYAGPVFSCQTQLKMDRNSGRSILEKVRLLLTFLLLE